MRRNIKNKKLYSNLSYVIVSSGLITVFLYILLDYDNMAIAYNFLS